MWRVETCREGLYMCVAWGGGGVRSRAVEFLLLWIDEVNILRKKGLTFLNARIF